MGLFRSTAPAPIDRLAEAEESLAWVVEFFDVAADELDYAQAVAANEAALVQDSIDALKARQDAAIEQADRATRVADKLRALVA